MSDHLPSEIVEEILQRLPGKSLVRFTSVCKGWNSLIRHKTFIHDHTIHQASNGNSDSIFFHLCHPKEYRCKWGCQLQQEDFYSLYSDSVDDEQTNQFSVERFPLSHLLRRHRHQSFAGTCNGLVCYADSLSDSETIIIWNPLLRKYVVLPQPIMTCNDHYWYDLCYGFGFDSKNNDYKVVRLLTHRLQEVAPHIEVYSLVSHSWKHITDGVPQFFFFAYADHPLPQGFVNGAIHWVANRRRGENLGYQFILSFDVNEEKFRELILPQETSHGDQFDFSRVLVVEGGRSLAVSNYNTITQMRNIWVMKEYGVNESWTEIFPIERSLCNEISNILALTRTGKLVVHLVSGDLALIDPVKGLVEHLESRYSRIFTGSYVESLFFLNNNEPNVMSF